MLYFLENDNYKVGIDTLGAELHHFIKKDENLEFIWQADPQVWASHAPNLFPIVGELPGQQYTFEGQKYDMKRHGFARRKKFELVEEHHDKLVFQLTEDEETLQQYPFEFRLLVAYTLEWNKLSVTYHVANTSKQNLYFSVGAHPGFNVPFYPNEEYEDYFIEFEKEETLHRHLLSEDGLQNGNTESVMEHEGKLALNRKYFYKDALVFKDVRSEKVTLGSPRNARRIEVEFDGFPYLGIWGKPEHPRYVCIEPWCGIAGRVGESGDITEKEGINQLAPEQTFARTYTITIL
ncbi:aldose 1-epimerase family protein [Pontibacter anaerobius]|uniref:Aldose 1-epimerase family protein n=1 Tax=Pontibacter anaerobius TaxID=2993940 RepID=A0ABT3RAW8_9BACT|nr:aldose 1-epimerase family protein [Pontibacter anaerobius]MCX2738576.1 aldose 1-epimerase family protein [Pontibacter anaerobius]